VSLSGYDSNSCGPLPTKSLHSAFFTRGQGSGSSELATCLRVMLRLKSRVRMPSVWVVVFRVITPCSLVGGYRHLKKKKDVAVWRLIRVLYRLLHSACRIPCLCFYCLFTFLSDRIVKACSWQFFVCSRHTWEARYTRGFFSVLRICHLRHGPTDPKGQNIFWDVLWVIGYFKLLTYCSSCQYSVWLQTERPGIDPGRGKAGMRRGFSGFFICNALSLIL
jgi:hypothetical protein